MTNENDLKNLWQCQPADSPHMSIDEIRRKSETFQKRIGRRNLREYAAAALVVLVFTAYAIFLRGSLVRIGSAMCVPAGIFVAWYLRKRGSAHAAPPELAASSGVEFHRRELERQRDLLRTFWLWNLAPFVPGIAVMLAGFGLGVYVAIPAVLILALWAFLWWGNLRAAAKLQSEIEALKSLEE